MQIVVWQARKLKKRNFSRKSYARSDCGIVHEKHTDENGTVGFRHGCKMGLEAFVSERLSAPYRSGTSRDWTRTARRWCGRVIMSRG
jgi:ATP-dependent DNA ligase